MSGRDIKRVSILDGIKNNKYSLEEASSAMSLSTRQVRRLYKQYQKEGARGILHKARGKTSNHQKSPELKANVIKLYREKYYDFGPTFAAEKLELDGFSISGELLRLWLKAEGLWQRQRKRKTIRKRRLRRESFGDLLQMDGSFHLWFGENEEKSCIINLIDDATGKVMSHMDKEETTYSAMTVLKRWIEQHGVPKAIYVDLKTVYVSPKTYKQIAEETQDKSFTHFSRACDKLGIKIIKAHSPQAKGRVERVHRVFQDRFIKELRLKKIKDIAGANNFLQTYFIDDLNTRFAKEPASSVDGHRPSKPFGNLDNIFCWESVRLLSNDSCVRYDNMFFQLEEKGIKLNPRDKITIKEHLDGKLSFWLKDKKISFKQIDALPKKEKKKLIPGPRMLYKPATEKRRKSYNHWSWNYGPRKINNKSYPVKHSKAN